MRNTQLEQIVAQREQEIDIVSSDRNFKHNAKNLQQEELTALQLERQKIREEKQALVQARDLLLQKSEQLEVENKNLQQQLAAIKQTASPELQKQCTVLTDRLEAALARVAKLLNQLAEEKKKGSDDIRELVSQWPQQHSQMALLTKNLKGLQIALQRDLNDIRTTLGVSKKALPSDSFFFVSCESLEAVSDELKIILNQITGTLPLFLRADELTGE